jgi:hypothetical protein
VVLKPVIDLSEHIATGAYEVPRRLEEQIRLRDATCVPVVHQASSPL